MDLAGPGQLGQHAIRAEPQGKGPPEVRQHDGDEFEFGRDDLEEFLTRRPTESIEKSTCRRPASSSSPTGAAARSPAGSTTSSAWRSTRRLGRASTKAEIVRAASRPQARELYALKEAELPVRVGDDPLPGRAVAAARPRATTATAWPPGPPSDSTRSSIPRSFGPAPPRDRGAAARAGPRALPGRAARRRARRQLEAAYGRRPAAQAGAAARPRGARRAGRLGPAGARRRDRPPTSSQSMTRDEIRSTLVNALDARHRPEMREMEKVAAAPDPRLELDGTPPRDGPPPQLDRPAGLRPDRPQGRVQARGHEDLRARCGTASATRSPT